MSSGNTPGLRDIEKEHPMTIQRYFDMIPQRLRPRIVDGFVHFIFPADEWRSTMESNYLDFLDNEEDVWEWLEGGKSWKEFGSKDKFSKPRSFFRSTRKDMEVTIRCKFDQIHDGIRSLAPSRLSKLYRSGLLGVSDSDVEARLRAGPVEEDYFIPSPARPEPLQQLVTQHGLDGRTYQVHIL
jgi:hypothetical protein